jgi:HAE1 family hydrophobic/amphiphilic exporter-1
VINEYAESTIAQRISMVNGVAQVNIFGAAKYAVRVDVDPRKLAAHSLGIDEVASAITNANVNLPTGTMYGDKTFVVQTNGQLFRANAYGPTIISYRGGNPIRLNEVAHVYDGIENDKSAAWYNGERTIYLAIQKQPGTNVVAVCDAVKALLPTFREQLPASLSLDVRTDRSIPIRESVHDVKFTLVLTICLVVLVIFLFLRNISATIIPSLALPASIVGHVRGDVPARLQPRQPVADGADAVGRLRRRRRDRDAGEHRPAHGDGQAADARRLRRLEGDLLHHHLDDHLAGRRSSSRCCSWAGSSAGCCTSSRVTISVAILVSGWVAISLTPMLCSRFLKAAANTLKARVHDNCDRADVHAWLRLYDVTLRATLRHGAVDDGAVDSR